MMNMALYLISYDISQKDAAEYQSLWDHLKKIGAVKILYSEWLVARGSTDAAASIYNEIAPLTKLPDRLLVQEVTQNAAWDKLLIDDERFRNLLRKYARQ
jgi:thioredoxin-like negative regulator of GroEL